MRHIPVNITIDGDCENLSLGSAGSCASLDHPDCNRGLTSLTIYLKKVVFFIMPIKKCL